MFKLAALALLLVAAASAVPVLLEEHSALVDSATGEAVTSTVAQQRSGGSFAYSVHEARQYPAPLVPAGIVPAPVVPVQVPVQVPGLQYAVPQTLVPAGAVAPAVIAAPYQQLPIQKV